MPTIEPDEHGGYHNVKFTRVEDYRLVKFIATEESPQLPRGGKKLYAVLGPQASDQYSWSRHRSSQSWMARYKNYSYLFDLRIKQFKAEHSDSNVRQSHILQVTSKPAVASAPATTQPGETSNKDLALKSLKMKLAAERDAARSRAALSSAREHPAFTLIPNCIVLPLNHMSPKHNSSPAGLVPPSTARPQLESSSPAPTARAESPPLETGTMIQALPKLHRKLSRLAHRTKTASVDRAWAVYAKTGTVERTREVLDVEAAASERVLQLTPPATEAYPAHCDTELHQRVAKVVRKMKIFSVDRGWAVYVQWGTVSRMKEALLRMAEMVDEALEDFKKGAAPNDLELGSRKRKRVLDDEENEKSPKNRKM
ncbi:hypothetical protein DFH07DRAFT_817129 [Mycena maculata]|uniref:DNA-binding protein RAP1 n=1 Tax=Mycena maculata TaxID=230809 RepID=A0AAD7JBN5_9AGAR|nr:hypothetical protein DFH07DRAFT_817129 [Mycena maculata]